MKRRRFIVVLSVILSGCGGRSRIPVIDKSPSRKIAARRIVRKGDTLFSIAWENGLDYQSIASWNGISKPYVIYPGQKLSLRPTSRSTIAVRPSKTTKTTKTTPKTTKTSKKTDTKAATKTSKKTSKKTNTKTTAKTTKKTTVIQQKRALSNWAWPVRGKLIDRFSSQKGVNGIRIAGKSGTPIKATQAGEVVYAGEGLRGYGRLIIVKHSSVYLSAYAHNRKILVKEGEHIKKSQQIAQMGNSGADRTMLHFEIRKHGKPVNPLSYLPAI